MASSLQSRINQTKQQENAVISVEDDEEEEEDNEVEIEVELDREEDPPNPVLEVPTPFSAQQIWAKCPRPRVTFRTVAHDYNATNGAEIELTLSEDEEDCRLLHQHERSPGFQYDSAPTPRLRSTQLSTIMKILTSVTREGFYYCKHCDFNSQICPVSAPTTSACTPIH